MEAQAYRIEISGRPTWRFREKYVDRGNLDPFYILEFKHNSAAAGDDLMDEPLFITRLPALRVKHLTRDSSGTIGSYWRDIDNTTLLARLDRFMTMYRHDYLQPPGDKGEHGGLHREHDRFAKKRFLYRITSPRKQVIGIGSQMYAGFGAIIGTVYDEEGKPLPGAIIELERSDQTLARRTQAEGEFWFSKAATGKHSIRVKGRTCTIKIIETLEFGNIKGWLADAVDPDADGVGISRVHV